MGVTWRCVLFSSYEVEALRGPDYSHCYNQGSWLKHQLTTAWDLYHTLYNNRAMST